jgi:hypothetical protein
VHANLLMLAVTLAVAVLLLVTVIAIVRSGDSINRVTTEDADMSGTYYGDNQL